LSDDEALAAADALLTVATPRRAAPGYADVVRPGRAAGAVPQEGPLVNPLFAAAVEVERFCERRGWQFCSIGALAVIRWGEPRLTRESI